MILQLSPLPASAVLGIYTVRGVADQLPERMRYLAPDAARSYRANLASGVVVSDMLRTAESSLQAVREKRGALPPGYSGHNFGLSIDVALEVTLRRMALSKADFDAWMEEVGWFCHRRDHRMESEAWHYNYLGICAVISPKVRTTADYLEAEIHRRHGAELAPGDLECQRRLADLGLYHGDPDGIVGPLTREAVAAFQRAWNLPGNGRLDPRTRRTLAFVGASRHLT